MTWRAISARPSGLADEVGRLRDELRAVSVAPPASLDVTSFAYATAAAATTAPAVARAAAGETQEEWGQEEWGQRLDEAQEEGGRRQEEREVRRMLDALIEDAPEPPPPPPPGRAANGTVPVKVVKAAAAAAVAAAAVAKAPVHNATATAAEIAAVAEAAVLNVEEWLGDGTDRGAEWPLTKNGDDDVYILSTLHRYMSDAGYNAGEEDEEDMFFGPSTQEALCYFQSSKGFYETGVADSETWEELLGAVVFRAGPPPGVVGFDGVASMRRGPAAGALDGAGGNGADVGSPDDQAPLAGAAAAPSPANTKSHAERWNAAAAPQSPPGFAPEMSRAGAADDAKEWSEGVGKMVDDEDSYGDDDMWGNEETTGVARPDADRETAVYRTSKANPKGHRCAKQTSHAQSLAQHSRSTVCTAQSPHGHRRVSHHRITSQSQQSHPTECAFIMSRSTLA
jgi:hypothetical protein